MPNSQKREFKAYVHLVLLEISWQTDLTVTSNTLALKRIKTNSRRTSMLLSTMITKTTTVVLRRRIIRIAMCLAIQLESAC